MKVYFGIPVAVCLILILEGIEAQRVSAILFFKKDNQNIYTVKQQISVCRKYLRISTDP